jgi:hypothetical protein
MAALSFSFWPLEPEPTPPDAGRGGLAPPGGGGIVTRVAIMSSQQTALASTGSAGGLGGLTSYSTRTTPPPSPPAALNNRSPFAPTYSLFPSRGRINPGERFRFCHTRLGGAEERPQLGPVSLSTP